MLGGLSGMTSLAMSYYMYIDNITHIRNAYTEKNREKQFIHKQLAFKSKYDPKTLENVVQTINWKYKPKNSPDGPDFFFESINAYVRTCIQKRAALITPDRDPKTLEDVVQLTKTAITNQTLIMEPKKNVRRVTFEENDKFFPAQKM